MARRRTEARDSASNPFVLPSAGRYFSTSLFNHSFSSFSVQTSESLSQKQNQVTPKHTTRNPNKTRDKKFQGICCSQKRAGSPAKTQAQVGTVLSAAPKDGCGWLRSRRSLRFWLSHSVSQLQPAWPTPTFLVLSHKPSTSSCPTMMLILSSQPLLPPHLGVPMSFFSLVPPSPSPVPNLGPVLTS